MPQSGSILVQQGGPPFSWPSGTSGTVSPCKINNCIVLHVLRWDSTRIHIGSIPWSRGQLKGRKPPPCRMFRLGCLVLGLSLGLQMHCCSISHPSKIKTSKLWLRSEHETKPLHMLQTRGPQTHHGTERFTAQLLGKRQPGPLRMAVTLFSHCLAFVPCAFCSDLLAASATSG